MSSGITFNSRHEADEYRKVLLSEGKSSELQAIPTGEFKVIIRGSTTPTTFEEQGFMTPVGIPEIEEIIEDNEEIDYSKVYIPTRGPWKNHYVTHGSKEDIDQKYWEEQQKEKERNKKQRKEHISKYQKITEKTIENVSQPITQDLSKGIEKAERNLNVKSGMKQSIPGKPYSGNNPRIGSEGAIGVEKPAIANVKKPNFKLIQSPNNNNSSLITDSPLKQEIGDLERFKLRP